MRNWTFQQTISPAETFAVEYRRKVGESYETASDEVQHAAVAEVFTAYVTIAYKDKDGKNQSQDVVGNTISTTTTCVGAVNPTRWKSKLEAGSPPFAGTVLTKRTETFNKYQVTKDGPVEVEVTTFEYEPRIAFAGGLAIEDYKNIDLGTGNVLVRKTIVEKLENKAADLTKQTTTVYQAWGATAGGKTVASVIAKTLKAVGNETTRIDGTYTLVQRMEALVCSGSEQTINIGRGTAPAQPTALEQQNDKLKGLEGDLKTNGPWNQNGGLLSGDGNKFTDLSYGTIGNSTSTYDLQFGPDSYLRPALAGETSDTGLMYVYASNKDAAYLYGKAIYTILSGMANGKSITTELRNLPSEPMGTLYMEAAGTVGRFRANGITFAFDAQGLIVGCDAMLDGGVGLLSGGSGADWFPMMVPATGLSVVTPASRSNPALANTITAPNGFDPMTPGNIWSSFGTTGVEGDVYAVDLEAASAIQAVAENLSRESVSRSLTWLLDAPYNLSSVSVPITSVASSSGIIDSIAAIRTVFGGSGSGVIATSVTPPNAPTSALLAFTGGTSVAWHPSAEQLRDGYGWSFTLSSAKTIKGVGMYDDGQNGLNGPYAIYLYDLSNYTEGDPYNTLPGVYFDAAETQYLIAIPGSSGQTQATLDGVWRRVNLSEQGATLQAGVPYLLMAGIENTYLTDNVIKGATITMLSGASFGQAYLLNAYASAFVSVPNDGNAYFGPMLFFE